MLFRSNVTANLYDNQTVTGTVNIGTATVPTLPHGRHIIFVSYYPSTSMELRIDGVNTTTTPGATNEYSLANLGRFILGDPIWPGLVAPRGYHVMESMFWANQTALTLGQKQALETYAFNEYGITSRA